MLCVALNRKAAAQATAAFENRCTAKVYLAVLHGHLMPSNWPNKSIAEEGKLPLPYGNKSHKQLKRKRIEAKSNGEETWQDRAKQLSVNKHYDALVKLMSKVDTEGNLEKPLSSEVVDKLRELSNHNEEEFLKNKKLRKELRKIVSSCGICVDVDQEEIKKEMSSQLKQDTDCCTAKSGDSLNNQSKDDGKHWRRYASIYCEPPSSPPSSMRAFFDKINSDVIKPHCTKSDEYEVSNKTLHVDIPIVDNEAGEFKMSLGVGSESSPGRPSHTEITVLEHGQYLGQPVTKVLFRPISGRRHQLRLHSLAVGHPIVGDATYDPHSHVVEAPRMMLHAYRLR